MKIGGSGFLCAKNLYETKYQFLIKKRKSPGSKYFNDSKGFIEYSGNMNSTYKSIEEYSPNKKAEILILFDDMIVDMLSKKN